LAELKARGARTGVAAVQQARLKRAVAARRAGLEEARARLARGDVSWVAGVVLYWCEGEKPKSWAPSRLAAFTNMDTASLLLFRRWLLQYAGVSIDAVSYDLRIHPDGDISGARSYWASVLGIEESVIKTYLKRPNPSTRRRNVGRGYYGTMRLRIRRSTRLLHWIEGCIQGVVEHCGVG
jgi:hypothetical protein